MNKINKYGYIHGGYSFSILDTKTHEKAVEIIGECMTSNASIYYHKPISEEIMENTEYNIKTISQTKNSALVQGQILKHGEEYVTGIFTFIKIKK